MENFIEFFLNTHLEWFLSHQDSAITVYYHTSLAIYTRLAWFVH